MNPHLEHLVLLLPKGRGGKLRISCLHVVGAVFDQLSQGFSTCYIRTGFSYSLSIFLSEWRSVAACSEHLPGPSLTAAEETALHCHQGGQAEACQLLQN